MGIDELDALKLYLAEVRCPQQGRYCCDRARLHGLAPTAEGIRCPFCHRHQNAD